MYPVSQKCLEAFSNYKRDLRFIITVDNSEINETDVMEFEINEGLMQSENFQLGGCVSTTISIKINNLHGMYSVEMLRGKEIRVAIGIVTTDSIEYVPMGVFIVDEVVDDKSFIKIEGLDNMIKFEKDYESKLQYPTTAKAMLQEMCSLCGVDLDTNSFKNENYIIDKPIDQERCRNILHDIAILAGGFAKINRNGKLELKTISDSGIEINKDNYITLNVKEKFFIDKFVVTETYFPIDTIPFNLEVIPFTSKWNGNPALDVGDTVKLNDDKSTVKSIVTKQKIKFSGGLTYESECNGISEQQQQTQLINQKQVNRKFASEIKQNAEEISMRVKNDELETIVKQNADSWGLSINGKLKSVNYVFDENGMLVKNGAIRIQDKDGVEVFGADETGLITYSGALVQKYKNGNFATSIFSHYIYFNEPNGNGVAVFDVSPIAKHSITKDALSITSFNSGNNKGCLNIDDKILTDNSKEVNYGKEYTGVYGGLGIFNDALSFYSNGVLSGKVYASVGGDIVIKGMFGNDRGVRIIGGYSDGSTITRMLCNDSGTTLKGNLTVTGTKNRIVDIGNNKMAKLNAVESAECVFEDFGEAMVGEDGEITINIDDIFLKTVNTDYPYQVFLQPYGEGFVYPMERNKDNFVIKGTPGLSFGWRIVCKQKGYEEVRLDIVENAFGEVEENERL